MDDGVDIDAYAAAARAAEQAARPARREEPLGRLHWGPRREQDGRPGTGERHEPPGSGGTGEPGEPGESAGPGPARPAYRVGTTRADAVAAAERTAGERVRRDRAASYDRAVSRAVSVVAREAESVRSGQVQVRRVVAEKRWIDPEQPFLMVSLVVTRPGPTGWQERDLEAVRDEVRRMALSVPGGPRDVVVFIDKAASGGPARR